MKTVLMATLLLGGLFNTARCETPLEIALWPNGLPEGATPLSEEALSKALNHKDPERIAYVAEPTLTLFQPDENANGACVIVCPGGAYNILAWPKEGTEVAEWFNSFGVTAAVLKYRVPRRDPEFRHREPLQDAQRAIRMVRSRATEWNVDPDRVGILGFSAGGNLTALTGMHWKSPSYPAQDSVDDVSPRPDFMCPIYAAYLGQAYADEGPLGELVAIGADTPPTFLAVTADDKERGVHAALMFVELQRAGVPVELHVYSKGGHGYGIRASDNPVSTWHHRLRDWMAIQGLLEPVR